MKLTWNLNAALPVVASELMSQEYGTLSHSNRDTFEGLLRHTSHQKTGKEAGSGCSLKRKKDVSSKAVGRNVWAIQTLLNWDSDQLYLA